MNRRDPALDELIQEITVDCYDEDEQLTAFETAFDNDATLPRPATISGQDIEVLTIATAQGRRELIATCRHAGHRYEIALLDIDLHADPPTTQLLAAYRQWTPTVDLTAPRATPAWSRTLGSPEHDCELAARPAPRSTESRRAVDHLPTLTA